MRIFRPFHISATGTGTILSNQGTLATVVVNTGAASAVLTLRNGGSGGTVLAVIDASSKSSATYLCHFDVDLYYALAGGNADITVSYE